MNVVVGATGEGERGGGDGEEKDGEREEGEGEELVEESGRILSPTISWRRSSSPAGSVEKMGGKGGCTGERAGSEQGSGMSWERSAGDFCAGKGSDGRSKGCLYNTMAKLLLRCCRRNWH